MNKPIIYALCYKHETAGEYMELCISTELEDIVRLYDEKRIEGSFFPCFDLTIWQGGKLIKYISRGDIRGWIEIRRPFFNKE